MFVAPNWFDGMLIQTGLFVVIPMIVALFVGLGVGAIADRGDKLTMGGLTFCVIFLIGMLVMVPVGNYIWWSSYEMPSVNEKVITVKEWQPKPGLQPNENGMMTINNADQLLLVTTSGDCYLNEENFLFNKFNTRDIFNQLKVGGTYKIKYYGWRNGFNSGFPNILSVTEVVNETGAKENSYSDYFGTKLA